MSTPTLSPENAAGRPPDDICEVFDVLCEGARNPGALMVCRVRSPVPGAGVHYVIGAVTNDRRGFVPIAIVPHGMSVAQFIEYFDRMAVKHPGAELDPDFKGVKQ